MASQLIENIHTAVIHTSATREGVYFDADDIDRMHRHRTPPFAMIGYHKVLLLNGKMEEGRPYTRRGAHVAGNNTNTIGLCMIGGLDKNGKPKDTYTEAQWDKLFTYLTNIHTTLTGLKRVLGHRDFSPDLDGDGLIEPHEWIKECPCFDVREKLLEWGLARYALPASVDLN